MPAPQASPLPRQCSRHMPPLRILHGVPPCWRAPAAALYWRHFARQIVPLPLSARRGEACLRRTMRPDHGLLALCNGQLVGIAGLRNAEGGLICPSPQDFAAVWGPRQGWLLSRLAGLAQGGAPTPDMVLDGVAVAPWARRQGVARALIGAAAALARNTGYPGLRAEIASGNRDALTAWLALGFQPQGRERLGWPWSRPAHVLRLPVTDQPSTGSARS